MRLNREQNEREIEATLIISSNNPKKEVLQIAGLKRIAKYQLIPLDSQMIHDYYFDTTDHALQSQKLAMRLREIGASRWITLKGRSKLDAQRISVERLEIEEELSKNAIGRIIKELMDRKINIQQQSNYFDYHHILDVFFNLGLEIIQDRKTLREVRNIVAMNEHSRQVLAVLAVDSVAYHFSGQEIYHHELEIEAKTEDGFKALKILTEKLIARYKSSLRIWEHSKLATGKAIEKLLSEGALEGLFDADNNLKPSAYNKIDHYIGRIGV